MAPVLILVFWAFLIWLWRYHQTEPQTGERRVIETPDRWV